MEPSNLLRRQVDAGIHVFDAEDEPQELLCVEPLLALMGMLHRIGGHQSSFGFIQDVTGRGHRGMIDGP